MTRASLVRHTSSRSRSSASKTAEGSRAFRDIRIIGCGNRHRGDDAAGVIAAERLRMLGIEARTCMGEPSELMANWNGADDVIVIDAVVTDAPVGAVHIWDDMHSLVRKPVASTHGLGVAEAIALARTLDRLPARLRVYGIEGKNFEIGGDVSVEVAQAVIEVVRRITDEIGWGQNALRPR